MGPKSHGFRTRLDALFYKLVTFNTIFNHGFISSLDFAPRSLEIAHFFSRTFLFRENSFSNCVSRLLSRMNHIKIIHPPFIHTLSESRAQVESYSRRSRDQSSPEDKKTESSDSRESVGLEESRATRESVSVRSPFLPVAGLAVDVPVRAVAGDDRVQGLGAVMALVALPVPLTALGQYLLGGEDDAAAARATLAWWSLDHGGVDHGGAWSCIAVWKIDPDDYDAAHCSLIRRRLIIEPHGSRRSD